MKKMTNKLLCTALAGVMGLTAMTGCGAAKIDGKKAFITYNEDTVTMGTANLMLRMNQASMLSYYAMFGGSTAGMWNQDAGDGKTYADSVKDSVEAQLKDMILLKQHAGEYDITVTEEEQKKFRKLQKGLLRQTQKRQSTDFLSVRQMRNSI